MAGGFDFNAFLNTIIPWILLLIAMGFLYVKLLKPYVIPWLHDAYEWLQAKNAEREEEKQHKEKVVDYSA